MGLPRQPARAVLRSTGRDRAAAARSGHGRAEPGPGSAGCISTDGSSQDGPGTCQTLGTLGRPFGISISSDDKFVYVTDQAVPARVHVFARDMGTGALSEVQCLSEAPAPAGCSTGRVLGESKSVVLSPDGRHAYSSDLHGISVFDRDPVTGLLTQEPGPAGCITDTGNDDTGASTCTLGRALNGTNALTISPTAPRCTGRRRPIMASPCSTSPATARSRSYQGSAGCITLSGSDGVGGVSCAMGRALSFPFGITISPDGHSLYVIADLNQAADGVAIFSVDPTTGAATQLPGSAGCITGDGTSAGVAGACADGGPALVGIYDPTVSPDGANVYLPGYDGQTLGIYRRETGSTPITIVPPAGQPPAGPPPPSGPPPAGGGGPQVTPPPVLTRLRESAATWREVRSAPRRPVTTFSFTLSEPARVTLTFTRQVVGRRVREPVSLPAPPSAALRRCLRTVTLGAVALRGSHRSQPRGFSGHLPALGWLPSGRITVTAVATAARRHSAARQLSFVVSDRTWAGRSLQGLSSRAVSRAAGWMYRRRDVDTPVRPRAAPLEECGGHAGRGAGCALALVATGCSGSSGTAAAAPPSGAAYTLMQMNLCLSGLADCYAKVRYPGVVREAIARIRETRPDAVTFNESCGGDVALIARRTGYHVRFSSVIYYGKPLPCIRPGGRGLFGDAVLTRAPIDSSDSQAFPTQAGPEQRKWLCVRTRAGVEVCTAHLASTDPVEAAANAPQCAELRALLARRAGGARPGGTAHGHLRRRRQPPSSCAPHGFWTRTDASARQDPGIQQVYGTAALRSPSARVQPAVHTDHDILLVRAYLTANAERHGFFEPPRPG